MGKSQNSNFHTKKVKVRSLTDINSNSSPVPIAGPGPGAESGDEDCEGGVMVKVECGPNVALLSLTRLQQGSRGACVRFDSTWITPNQFQLVSGRETAKDWKRSIKHHGKSLKVLLANDIMVVQPPVCLCEDCTGQPPPLPKKAPKVKKTSIPPAANVHTRPQVCKDDDDAIDTTPQAYEQNENNDEQAGDINVATYRAPGLYRMAMPLSPGQAAIRANILRLMEKNKNENKRKQSEVEDGEADDEADEKERRKRRRKKKRCAETVMPYRGDVFDFHDDAGDVAKNIGEVSRQFNLGCSNEQNVYGNENVSTQIHPVNNPALLPVATFPTDLGKHKDECEDVTFGSCNDIERMNELVGYQNIQQVLEDNVAISNQDSNDLQKVTATDREVTNEQPDEIEGHPGTCIENDVKDDLELKVTESEDWRLAEEANNSIESDEEDGGQNTVLSVTTPITLPVTKLNTSSPKSLKKACRLSSIIEGLHLNKQMTENNPPDHHGDAPEVSGSASSRHRLRQHLLIERKSTSMETVKPLASQQHTSGVSPDEDAKGGVFPSSDGRSLWRAPASLNALKVAAVPPITRPASENASNKIQSPRKVSVGSKGQDELDQNKPKTSQSLEVSSAASLTWYLPYYASLGLANMMMVPYLSSQMMALNSEALNKLTSVSGTSGTANTSTIAGDVPVCVSNTTASASSVTVASEPVTALTSVCSSGDCALPTDQPKPLLTPQVLKTPLPVTCQPENPLDLSRQTLFPTISQAQKSPATDQSPILDLSPKRNCMAPRPSQFKLSSSSSQPTPLKAVRENGATPTSRRKSPAFPGSEGILNPALGALSKWTTEDVTKFVSSVEGCQDYIKNFKAFGVCGKSLPFLSLDHMRDLLHMRPSAAVSLRSAIDRLLLLPDSVLSTYV